MRSWMLGRVVLLHYDPVRDIRDPWSWLPAGAVVWPRCSTTIVSRGALLDCVEPYMAKRADGTDVLAYRPVRSRPGCR